MYVSLLGDVKIRCDLTLDEGKEDKKEGRGKNEESSGQKLGQTCVFIPQKSGCAVSDQIRSQSSEYLFGSFLRDRPRATHTPQGCLNQPRPNQELPILTNFDHVNFGQFNNNLFPCTVSQSVTEKPKDKANTVMPLPTEFKLTGGSILVESLQVALKMIPDSSHVTSIFITEDEYKFPYSAYDLNSTFSNYT
ncbi:unnamed protein product [Ambrosiozyma monospora]|uniref:Unnamed protein product n=1 Tax=Ambrosiozyma monospora TaxID=43982 RepID=A0ACB5SQQ4_AMBMO|nr:unnamed protein product [Ambrosiozyma monospora]